MKNRRMLAVVAVVAFLSAALLYAAPNPNPAVVAVVELPPPPPPLEITTTGDLRLIQTNDESERTLEITAVATPPGDIAWEFEGDGRKWVRKRNVEKTVTATSTTSKLTLVLWKDDNPNWDTWDANTKVKVVATSGAVKASTEVKMLKFRRGNTVAAGSKPVVLELIYGKAKIGFEFTKLNKGDFTKSGDETKFWQEIGPTALTLKKEKDTKEKKFGQTTAAKFYYTDSTDVGSGKYTLNVPLGFKTSFDLKATAVKDKLKEIDMNMEAAALASYDSESLPFSLTFASAARRSAGPPTAVTVTLKLPGDETIDVPYMPLLGLGEVSGKKTSVVLDRKFSYDKIPQGAQVPISEEKAINVKAAQRIHQSGDWNMEVNVGVVLGVNSLSWKLSFHPDF